MVLVHGTRGPALQIRGERLSQSSAPNHPASVPRETGGGGGRGPGRPVCRSDWRSVVEGFRPSFGSLPPPQITASAPAAESSLARPKKRRSANEKLQPGRAGAPPAPSGTPSKGFPLEAKFHGSGRTGNEMHTPDKQTVLPRWPKWRLAEISRFLSAGFSCRQPLPAYPIDQLSRIVCRARPLKHFDGENSLYRRNQTNILA